MTNRHAQAEHVSNTTTAPPITPTRNVAHTIDQTLARNRGRERDTTRSDPLPLPIGGSRLNH